MKIEKLFSLLFLILLLTQCSRERKKVELNWHQEDGYRWANLHLSGQGKAGFRQLSSNETGITFQNYLAEESYVKNRVLLSGSGVAAGDINGDGWPDLYFTQIDGPNKLYLNKGNFSFKDTTSAAGAELADYMSAGTVMADVDGDQDLDILVTTYHQGTILLLNDGNGGFTQNQQSGLDSTTVGGTTMTLADIEGDGDLDLYVTHYNDYTVKDLFAPGEFSGNNVAVREGNRFNIKEKFREYYTKIQSSKGPTVREVGTQDELYLNKGGIEGNWNGFEKVENLKDHFLDENGNPVGIGKDWGLTARFEDVNGDGLPDLYVCNDFWPLDQFWINQGDGIFKKIDPLKFRHMSYSSMGVAIGDINNDGHSDLFVTDMLSMVRERRLRQMENIDPFPIHSGEIENQPQYTQNSLYINRGDNTYTETASYSGVAASGWSWGTTFMDADLDGRMDLFINTGYPHDILDLDTAARLSQRNNEDPYNLERYRRGRLFYPPLNLLNRAYKNEGDLTFSNVSNHWGFTQEDVSHGLVKADLNQDGALDIVTNRMNDLAGVFENTSGANRLAVRLIGSAPNTHAIGARVKLQGSELLQDKKIVSGGEYLSHSAQQLMFAVNANNPDPMLSIIWPDGTKSTIDSLRANVIYEIYQNSIPTKTDTPPPPVSFRPAFTDVSDRIDFTDSEKEYNDFNRQPFMPVRLSQLGPGVAWLDYNDDGRTDLLQTSGEDGQLAVFRNEGQGNFREEKIPGMREYLSGDQTSIVGWRTANGINLVVGRSNYEESWFGGPSASNYQIRDGQIVQTQQLPGTGATTGPLAASDYNRDGTVDLFVGGRVIPGKYPESASSSLFKYENGEFVPDQANTKLLQEIGMITSAVFTDYNDDRWPDLLLSTEWGSLLLFENNDGQFRNVTSQLGLDKYQGWWNGVATGDFNGDGRADIVATNWGNNSRYQIVGDHPIRMYYGNLDGDDYPDIIQANYDNEMEAYVPTRRMEFYIGFMPIHSNIRSIQDYIDLPLTEIMGPLINRMTYKEINTLASMVFINKEGEKFESHPLPLPAQLTASFDASVGDYNNDGNEDIFLSQNFFDLQRGDVRMDGGRGLWLRGDGSGQFTAVPGHHSGVKIYGEQQAAALGDFNSDGRIDLVVTQNGNRTKLYQNQTETRGYSIRLVGPENNRDAIGANIRLEYENGQKGPVRTLQAGSGNWSQDSVVQVIGFKQDSNPIAINVIWPNGRQQRVPLQPDKWNYQIDYNLSEPDTES